MSSWRDAVKGLLLNGHVDPYEWIFALSGRDMSHITYSEAQEIANALLSFSHDLTIVHFLIYGNPKIIIPANQN